MAIIQAQAHELSLSVVTSYKVVLFLTLKQAEGGEMAFVPPVEEVRVSVIRCPRSLPYYVDIVLTALRSSLLRVPPFNQGLLSTRPY